MQAIKHTVLIIDDEPQIRKFLRVTLETDGFRVEEAETGMAGIRLTASLKPDTVILDLGLPDMDGLEVIQKIREWSQVPIIVLSVRSQDKDMISALDKGASDYVIKPFGVEVLLARLRANLRKALQGEVGDVELTNGTLSINLLRHQVRRDGELIALSPKEYNLLRYFMMHCGKMLTHQQILKEVWGAAHGEDTQYLRVYVGQLRQKIEPDPSSPIYIITEPGIGYRMEEVETPTSPVRRTMAAI